MYKNKKIMIGFEKLKLMTYLVLCSIFAMHGLSVFVSMNISKIVF